MFLALLLKSFTWVMANLKLVLIALAVAIVLYFVVGYFHLSNELASTKAELAQAQAQVDQLKKDVTDIRTAHDELSAQALALQKKTDELTKQLDRNGKSSLSELALKHAKLVEKAVNNGTVKVLKCIETVSSGGNC